MWLLFIYALFYTGKELRWIIIIRKAQKEEQEQDKDAVSTFL